MNVYDAKKLICRKLKKKEEKKENDENNETRV